MADHAEYFNYLMRRSYLGLLYRRNILYPRIVRRLTGKTLDVGCGIGDMLTFRPGTTGVDVNPLVVNYCRSMDLDARVMQPDQLPHADASFDSVLMDNVLEHIAQPAPLLKDVHRVLKPSGRLVIGVPGRKGFAADRDHKVYYDEQLLGACLAKHDFRQIDCFYAPMMRSALLSSLLEQYCLYATFQRV